MEFLLTYYNYLNLICIIHKSKHNKTNMNCDRLREYAKIFAVLQNKPNTLWLSRAPDKTLHVATFRPRYVNEHLGRVKVTGGDASGNVITEWSKSDIEIGFEVTNMTDKYIAVDMFHEGKVVSNIALKGGARYFFDNRNILDKRRFSLKKKLEAKGPGGAVAPVLFSESKEEDNNIYKFRVYHEIGEEWPQRLALNVDDEIKVPYKEIEAKCFYSTESKYVVPHRRMGESSERSGLKTKAGGRGGDFGSRGPGAPAAAAVALPLPVSTQQTYVAEQQLGSTNTEELGSRHLNLDMNNFTDVVFITVLKE